jgi:hypothetical protein
VAEAQAVVDEATSEELERVRADAATRLEAMREEIDALNDQLQMDASDFDLPEIPEIPEADQNGVRPPAPFLDSEWDFAEQCQALTDSKRYEDGGTS